MKTVVDTLGVNLTAVREWAKGNTKRSHSYQKTQDATRSPRIKS